MLGRRRWRWTREGTGLRAGEAVREMVAQRKGGGRVVTTPSCIISYAPRALDSSPEMCRTRSHARLCARALTAGTPARERVY